MTFCVRYLIAFLAITGIMVSYICRYNISVAIVAMVKKPEVTTNSTLNATVVEPMYGHSGGEFEWDETTQGIVLGAYYYGYTIFQIFGGRMTEMFGAKWIFGISMFVSGFVNIISPLAAHQPVYVFIACRAILGASQSAVFPSAYGLFCKWMPEEERGTFLAMLNVGGSVGIILSNLMSGYLCKSEFLSGWPAVFYISGVFCFIWLSLWITLATSDPQTHRWLSKKELELIEKRETVKPNQYSNSSKTPWIKIFTSPRIWSYATAKFCTHYAHNLIILKAPSFMDAILRFPIDKNGLINSWLSLSTCITMTIGGIFADFLLRKQIINKTYLRKSFESLATFGTAIALVFIPVFEYGKISSVILLFCMMFCYGMVSGGDIPMAADMSVKYPATIFAFGNMLASTTGFITPSVVGFILGDTNQDIHRWNIIFETTAAVSAFGGIVFLLFASAEPINFE